MWVARGRDGTPDAWDFAVTSCRRAASRDPAAEADLKLGRVRDPQMLLPRHRASAAPRTASALPRSFSMTTSGLGRLRSLVSWLGQRPQPHLQPLSVRLPTSQGPQRVLTFLFGLFSFCFFLFFFSAVRSAPGASGGCEGHCHGLFRRVFRRPPRGAIAGRAVFRHFVTRPLRRRRLWRRVLFAGIARFASGASIGVLEGARHRAFTGSRVGLEGLQTLWAVGGVLLFLLGWVTLAGPACVDRLRDTW